MSSRDRANQRSLRGTSLSSLPAAQEQVDLLLATDERRAGRAQRLEPTSTMLGRTTSYACTRLAKHLRLDTAEIAILEQSAQPTATTSVDVGARMPQARSVISARTASIDQSTGSTSPNGASAASSAAGSHRATYHESSSRDGYRTSRSALGRWPLPEVSSTP
jgi:hypothetical protein